MAPVLMFCVGAAKAGTSWLYEQLAAHPDCHLRSIKELHFFDAKTRDRVARDIKAMTHARDGMATRLAVAPPARQAALTQRIADRDDWIATLKDGGTDAYLSYLRQGSGNARLIGDVTPAYALLPVAVLRGIAALVPDTRFIYLLRDPVARLWSHIRMIARRRAAPDAATPERANRILRRTFRGDETEIAARGDYAAALRRLDAAVDPRKLLVMFHEDLFAPGGFARICTFLGIAPREGDISARVHEGADLAMSNDQFTAARDWLAPQYECVKDRFGTLPDAWSLNMKGV